MALHPQGCLPGRSRIATFVPRYPYGESWYGTERPDASVLRKYIRSAHPLGRICSGQARYMKETEASSGQIHYATYREHGARIGRFHMADDAQTTDAGPQGLNRYIHDAFPAVLPS